jgi:anti-sigma B factor antagonist
MMRAATGRVLPARVSPVVRWAAHVSPSAADSYRRAQVEGLQLSSQRRGDIAIIAIGGDLDIVTSRELDECLATARRGCNHVILDLSAVEFMDTSSLAVIVGHWKKLVTSGGTLALAGARYRYTKTLWITGLADRLPLYESVDEAEAAAQAAAPAAKRGPAKAAHPRRKTAARPAKPAVGSRPDAGERAKTETPNA